MKVLVKKTAIIFCLIILSASLVKAEDWAKVKKAIAEMNDKWVKATLAEDVEGMMIDFADNAVSLPEYQPALNGKEQIRKDNQESVAKGWKYYDMQLISKDIFGSGDLAIDQGEWKATFSMPGKTEKISDNGKYINVWQKQPDGSWKIKLETWNTSKPPKMPETKMPDTSK